MEIKSRKVIARFEADCAFAGEQVISAVANKAVQALVVRSAGLIANSFRVPIRSSQARARNGISCQSAALNGR